MSINELTKILVLCDEDTILPGSEIHNFVVLRPPGELADCKHIMSSVS